MLIYVLKLSCCSYIENQIVFFVSTSAAGLVFNDYVTSDRNKMSCYIYNQWALICKPHGKN